MSILIRGMEMPKDGSCVTVQIWSDGRVVGVHNDSFVKQAISVPTPHGRLIDADNLIDLCNIMADKCDDIGEEIWHQFAATVEWSPTIIPAEEGE